jgi:hypothetical protein
MDSITSLPLQYGAFAICIALVLLTSSLIALLGVVIKLYIKQNSDMQKVVANNTRVIDQMCNSSDESLRLLRQLNDRLLARPCQQEQALQRGAHSIEGDTPAGPPPGGTAARGPV